ncbi:MAG TPA: glycosyltransferase [Phycisphaerales bacterium]|nr:glycosyltransferase [Phycisphaerales bacterium]
MIDPRAPNYASTPIAPDRAQMHYAPAPLSRLESEITPAASIVTPFFNTGEIFHETAACVLGLDARDPGRRTASGQSLQNLEWIIVNDASTDPGSLRVLAAYRALAARDRRIRIIDHAKNHGLPSARNTGWRAARSRFVLFLDSDDLIEPTTLEKSVLFLACNLEFAFVKGRTVGFGAENYLWSRGFHEREEMLRQNLVTATTTIRRSVLEAVGGFDETIRGGMEDWEFWLRCAAMGHWGDTIPEHLDWYRRRDNQHAAWDNISLDNRRELFLRRVLRARRRVFGDDDGAPAIPAFPAPSREWPMPFAQPGDPFPPGWLDNPLRKPSPRLLMIVPWLRMGGADRFNLDLARYLTREAGWEITLATTLPGHPWLSEFTAITPDVFCLDHIANPIQFPRLLDHLMASRRPDVVMVSNSQLGYFVLPFLRSRHPDATYIDFNHMEEPNWQNGGHARTGCGYQEQLDLSVVVSEHLKRWMGAPPRNADPRRIEVCHINADTRLFRPDPAAREEWRSHLGVGKDTPVILYAARLCPQKQPMVFARTMRLLADMDKSFLALVAGEGELGEQLAGALAEHRLDDRVRMLGPIDAARMPRLMAAADIFFLPSAWEGIALSIYEAMAAGLCVVGADVGGQAELVTPDTGVLLPFARRGEELEARAYAQTLAVLIDDPARAAAMGAAARERIIRHFELETMGRRMLEILGLARAWHRERPRQAISEGFARELALQGVEMMRIQDLAEELWPYRQKWLDAAGGAASEAEAQRDAEAAAELERLSSSRAWRAIQAIKDTPPYAILARARFGPDWRLVDPKEPPHVRVARIRTSRAYRVVRAIERLRGRADPRA